MKTRFRLERTHTKIWLDRSGLEPDKPKRIKELNSELTNKVAELTGLLELEKDRSRALEQELSRRENRFFVKDMTMRKTLEEYEQASRGEVEAVPLSELGRKHIEKIEALHKQLTQSISGMQHKTAQEIRRSEEQIVKQFDNRLKEMSTNLETDKRMKYETIQTLAEKESLVQRKLDLLTASLQLIENKNRDLEVENKQLKLDLKLLKQEHHIYIKMSCSQRSLQGTGANSPVMMSSTLSPQPQLQSLMERKSEPKMEDAKILRYEKVISKLKKMLDLERKALKQSRAVYAKELEGRNELQLIIRQAIESVQEESRQVPAVTRDKVARRLMIEKLANDEKILTFLYDAAFAKVTAKGL
jgi:hypothetical protein